MKAKAPAVLERARIAVVIPAFNEEGWIAGTVRSIPDFVDRIIVIDDASRDRTAIEAEEQGDPRVEVIRHADNRGVGAAIVTGYRRALGVPDRLSFASPGVADRLGSPGADVIAVMAGDGQMDPEDLTRVLLPVIRGEADYVKGDRLAHPEVLRVMPTARLVGTAALAFVTRLAAGLDRLSDSQCGYTAISARALDALGPDLDALWPRYGYPNDLLGALARRDLRIHEVVVRPVYRGEASGLRFFHLATIGYVIARVALRRFLRARAPSPLPDPDLAS